MALAALLSRGPSSMLALVVGALACGGDGAVILVPGSGGALSPDVPSAEPELAEAAPEPPAPAPSALPGSGGVSAAPEVPVAAEPAAPPASGAGREPATDGTPSQASPAEQPAPADDGAAINDADSDDADSDDADSDDADSDDADSDDPDFDSPSGSGAPAQGGAPSRQSASQPGPYAVDVITRGLRDGPDCAGQTLYVPGGAEPPLAAVVIVPGRDEAEASIQPWGPFLASHGLAALTVAPNDPGAGPDERALALLDALETIRAEHEREGGPLEGRLALDHLGVMGWSAGGAAALRVASLTPSLKAAIAMAPYSPGGTFPEDEVPTLLLAGSADPRAGGHSQGVFQSLPASTPRLLFEIEGGGHEVANDPRNASGEVGLYGLAWLQVYLVGDERYSPLLRSEPTHASDFRVSEGDSR